MQLVICCVAADDDLCWGFYSTATTTENMRSQWHTTRAGYNIALLWLELCVLYSTHLDRGNNFVYTRNVHFHV